MPPHRHAERSRRHDELQRHAVTQHVDDNLLAGRAARRGKLQVAETEYTTAVVRHDLVACLQTGPVRRRRFVDGAYRDRCRLPGGLTILRIFLVADLLPQGRVGIQRWRESVQRLAALTRIEHSALRLVLQFCVAAEQPFGAIRRKAIIDEALELLLPALFGAAPLTYVADIVRHRGDGRHGATGGHGRRTGLQGAEFRLQCQDLVLEHDACFALRRNGVFERFDSFDVAAVRFGYRV